MSQGRRQLRANPPGVGTPDPAPAPEHVVVQPDPAPPGTPPSVSGSAIASAPASAPANAPGATSEPPLEGFDRAVRLLVVGTGVLAWGTAGFLVLIGLAMTPRDGLSGGASLFKAVDVVAWVVMGALTLRDAVAMRRRTFVMGLAALALVFALTWLVGQTAFLAAGEGV